MADMATELNELFAQPNSPLQSDVLGELQSIIRVHGIEPQELFFKWEAYSIKMGTENTTMAYKTAKDFKKDLQDALERESRGKTHLQSASKRGVGATPRNANTGDVYGVLDGLVTGTPRPNGSAASKRRNNFATPAAKASKVTAMSSPSERKAPNGTSDLLAIPFNERQNAGQIIESLNSHIPIPEPPSQPPTDARVKLKANSEIAKFAYRPMAMKLSEASEILDDRIDEFASLIQEHHNLPDSAFGNPAAQSTAEIVAVGRVASDTSEGKLNAASLVLETSRRVGAGLRVPLRMGGVTFDLFPGKIVALRGINASGEQFTVSEVLRIPLLNQPASLPAEMATHNARQQAGDDTESRPLNIMIGSGPFTTDTDLSYAALHALLDRAAETVADVLILTGPFLDIEHPLIASGDFSLPPDFPVEPDHATITDAFRAFISTPLNRLTQRNPAITIILVPSVRDAISKHVSWPQDRFPRRELGLPKQVTCVTNPITLSINEMVFGISSQDVLAEMQRQRVSQGKSVTDDPLAQLSRNVVEQRHFFPVFPPLESQGMGASLDLSYLKLGEWLVRPDVLICPSMLTPFPKVVEGVYVINPGTLSKKRGAGTFAQMTVVPRRLTEEESNAGGVVAHEVYKRARCEVIRI